MNERKRRAFIGASTAGIGRAIAESLSASGVDIIINGRNENKNLAVAESISAQTGIGWRFGRATLQAQSV